MKLTSRTTIAATGAALAVAAGAGGALAAGGGGPGPGPGNASVASYLGLTAADLRSQLESGKTLAQIAAAQGKSVSGLEDAVLAGAEARLDRAVANGRLTATQEQTALAELKSHLDDIVNHSGPPPGRGHRGGGPGGGARFAAAAASYLGLTQAELRTQLQAGKSLAQLATAQGKSVDGLKAAILTGAKARLDQAVAKGRLSATQEQSILAGLTSHLDDLVNRSGTAGHFGRPPGRGHP